MANDEKPPTVGQVAGRNLRRLRVLHQQRQEDVARRARTWGLDWSRSVIASIENGGRQLGADELMLLCIAVPAPPSELLAGDDESLVALGATGLVHLGSLRAMYCAPSAFWQLSAATASQADSDVAAAKNRDANRATEIEADQKAARRLGLRPAEVALMARELWGRSLSAERDARVESSIEGAIAQRSRQALRGHVTRALQSELAEALASAKEA